MKIRELEEKDFESLSKLILSVYEDTPSALTFEGRPSAAQLDELMRKKAEGLRNKSIVDLVAVEGGRVVGDCEIVKTTGSGGTIGIIVDEAYRERGLGQKLLERSVEKAREIKVLEVYAEIDADNEEAVEFFAKCGFREQVEGNGLVMVRNL